MRREDGTEETAMPVIFVDAQTGEKVFEYDNLQTASGASLYSGTVNIKTSVSGSTYYMEDTTRRMGTFNMNNTGNTTYETGGTHSRYTDTNDIWDTTAQKTGVDALLEPPKLTITLKTFTVATALTATTDPVRRLPPPIAQSL